MENQQKRPQRNLRFYKNEDFASSSIEMLHSLGCAILQTESFYVPDEMRSSFQSAKKDLLELIDVASGSIRFMRNYKNDYISGEDRV